MLILGIDPGLHLTGYGFVETHRQTPRLVEGGVLRMKTTAPLPERLAELHRQMTALLRDHKVDRMAVEQLYAHYKHPRTAILMGHARGVILCAAAAAGVEVENLPSTLVKKSITGNGHASKAQIQLAIASLCKLAAPPEPPDVADAIAIAWTLSVRLGRGMHAVPRAGPSAGRGRIRRRDLPAAIAAQLP